MLPLTGTADEASALRAGFERGGLGTRGIASTFGLDHGDRAVLLGPRAVPVGDAPAAVRLWFLGQPVDERDLDVLPAGRLEELGLVVRDAGRLSSPWRITQVAGRWFLGDRPTERVSDLPSDHVLGPTASALTLSHLTVRRPGRAALDLGTGCGIHAILAAAHHEHVVATDIAERALHLGRWAAWVNDVPNVSWRLGDLFQPVAGEEFDLVVSSPPFVISPDVSASFRDAGHDGDDLSRLVAAGASAHLAPGGIATVLVNWGCRPGEEDAAAALGWVGGAIDALCLVHRVDGLQAYASRWAEPVAADAEEHRSLVDRWAASYAASGWDRIASGALVLRRPRELAPRWRVALDTPASGLGEAGDQLAGIVHRLDAVAGGIQDDLVLDTAPFVVDQELGPLPGGGLRAIAASVRTGGGLPFRRDLDRVGLALLGLADGRRTVAELVAAVAAELGAPEDAVAGRVHEVLGELVPIGYLVPA